MRGRAGRIGTMLVVAVEARIPGAYRPPRGMGRSRKNGGLDFVRPPRCWSPVWRTFMDPITLGASVATILLSNIGQKLIAKAADPEKVASGVSWLFQAVSHFFKIRKKQSAADTTLAPPPAPTVVPATNEAGSTPTPSSSPVSAERGAVRLKALDDFTAAQLEQEITSLLKQIDTYLGNLRFEEEKAAFHGGASQAPVYVRNMIRLQQREVGRRLVRLNAAINKAYGVSAPDLDLMAAALEE